MSDFAKQNRTGENNSMYGKHHTKETIQKIIKTNLERGNYEKSSKEKMGNRNWETIKKINPILMINLEKHTVNMFLTMAAAKKYLFDNGLADTLNVSSIRKALGHSKKKDGTKYKTAFGHVWVYVLDLLPNKTSPYKNCTIGQNIVVLPSKKEKLEDTVLMFFKEDKDAVVDVSARYDEVLVSIFKNEIYNVEHFVDFLL